MDTQERQGEGAVFREGIMNRIGWFTHLRVVFDNTPKDAGPKDLVTKSAFLIQLIESQSVLALLLT